MTIKQWNRAVQALKEYPNIPVSDLAEIVGMNCNDTWHLIKEVVETWKLDRKAERPKKMKKVIESNEIPLPKRIGKWRS